MSLFEEQLKALKTTMSSVEPKQFDMAHWHCGTVACVCGHQAVSGNLKHFYKARVVTAKHISSVANSIAADLQQSTDHSPALSNLSLSIWDANKRERLAAATYSKLLTPKQLKHPHLTTESSPEDVISYIDMILGELNDVICRTT
jgi:hypothetical protein